MRAFSKVVIGAALALGVAAKSVEYYWDIAYLEANPDGQLARRVIGVNGGWPPPTLHATLNDTLTIEVRNSLDVGVTLHAHGLLQNDTSYMDGADGVTQCSIPPGSNFTYAYRISQTGSYWAHAHTNLMYADGLRAPLVLHNPEEPHAYDEDVVVTFEDWYHQEGAELIEEYYSWKNPGGAEPVPKSALVRIDGDGEGVWRVRANTTYRLRLINMSALSSFHFAIEGHDLQVIEVDGVDTHAYTVTNVLLAAAQRVSVLVSTRNTTSFNYVYRVDLDTDLYDAVPDDLVFNLTGVVQYANDAPVKREDTEWYAFPDIELTPVDAMPALGFDVSYDMEIEFGQYTDARNHGAFNNITYMKPSLPALMTALTAKDPFDPLAYGRQTNTRVIEYMKEVQLVVRNSDSGSHPIHMHTAQFQIIARGTLPYNETQGLQPSPAPMRRDTIMIAAGEFAVLRFRADNLGVLFVHCHIVTLHQYTGLAAQFIVGPDVMQQTMRVPKAIYDQCQQQGIAVSGAAREQDGPVLYPAGWTARAKGALAGCILAALFGFATILWYGWSSAKYQPVPEAVAEN